MARTFKPVPADTVPAGLVFDVPRNAQGQTIEVAYAETQVRGRWVEYRRTTDQSMPAGEQTSFARR